MKKIIQLSIKFSITALAGLSVSRAAIIITAADLKAASSNPGAAGAADLGDLSISVGSLTVSSSGTSGTNIGWAPAGINNPANAEAIGIVGNDSEWQIGDDGGTGPGTQEVLTFTFSQPVYVNSINLSYIGGNDDETILSGFLSDPGASLSVAGGSRGDGFNSLVYNASNNLVLGGDTPFTDELIISFANSAPVSNFTLSGRYQFGAAGAGFSQMEYTIIPEPSSLVLLLTALGVLALRLRKRNR